MTNVVDKTLSDPEEETAQIYRLTWDQFQSYFRWEQGEHVALIGPTGSGKTTLTLALLDRRRYVVVFGTKPRDKVLASLSTSKGYKRIEQWADGMSPNKYPRRLLWPDAREMGAADNQRRVFTQAMGAIYRQGYWCVCIDELWYFMHTLKMEHAIKTYLQQARSLKISLIAGTQRPAFVPLEVYDQSTHLFFWRDNDERNLHRISGISWLSADLVRQCVARLAQYDVLYINTRTGDLIVTTPPPPPATKKRGG